MESGKGFDRVSLMIRYVRKVSECLQRAYSMLGRACYKLSASKLQRSCCSQTPVKMSLNLCRYAIKGVWQLYGRTHGCRNLPVLRFWGSPMCISSLPELSVVDPDVVSTIPDADEGTTKRRISAFTAGIFFIPAAACGGNLDLLNNDDILKQGSPH